MTYAINPSKALGEILEPATPPQFIPAQPELFLPVLDKVVNGIMIEHGSLLYRRGRLAMIRFVAVVETTTSHFVETTLPGMAGW
jgi:hypothetical protein